MSTIKLENIQTRTGSGTITIGTSGETVNLGTGVTSNIGITMAQQWRLTSDVTADSDPITNWEIADDPSAGSIGTGMTLNSGIFTFPQTGIYRIDIGVLFVIGVADVVSFQTFVTKDNGSSYDQVQIVQEETSSRSGYGAILVDITDTANDKVKFVLSSLNAGNNIRGDTDQNETFVIFTRLGNT